MSEVQDHQRHLDKCCRVCGCIYGKVAKAKTGHACNGFDKKSGAPFAELLQHVFGIFVDYDINDVHPKKFCHKCYLVLSKWCVAQERKQQYRPTAREYLWLPHDSTFCSFCARFVRPGKSCSGKRVVKKVKTGNLHQKPHNEHELSNQPSKQLDTPQHCSRDDHNYAHVPAHALFSRVRKRKHEDNLPTSSKKRVMSMSLMQVKAR